MIILKQRTGMTIMNNETMKDYYKAATEHGEECERKVHGVVRGGYKYDGRFFFHDAHGLQILQFHHQTSEV